MFRFFVQLLVVAMITLILASAANATQYKYHHGNKFGIGNQGFAFGRPVFIKPVQAVGSSYAAGSNGDYGSGAVYGNGGYGSGVYPNGVYTAVGGILDSGENDHGSFAGGHVRPSGYGK